jgi:hypothetical protein
MDGDFRSFRFLAENVNRRSNLTPHRRPIFASRLTDVHQARRVALEVGQLDRAQDSRHSSHCAVWTRESRLSALNKFAVMDGHWR